MRKKKIAMYFNQEKAPGDPFSDFGHKRLIYHYFFSYGVKLGYDMYIASGKENYLGGLKFKNLLQYKDKTFQRKNTPLSMDAIYDRCGGTKFPPPEISAKVLNCSDFKVLCNDKNHMYQLLGNWMPKSFEINSQQELEEKLNEFFKSSLVVLKPAKGLGGKGIAIDTPIKIKKEIILPKKTYVLQEFVDTSGGISDLTDTYHDLRVVIIEGKIIFSHIRTPKKGSLLANVAQGGTIEEVALDKLPNFIIEAVTAVQNIIDKRYNKPIYSIDFGVMREKPFIFELNDQIGFPSIKMKSAYLFIESLFESLERLAHNE